jgi:hypothetical protein
LIVIEAITLQNLPLFKAVRLRALQEAPYAFGSTYARESAFTESEWVARLDRWNGQRGVGFIAVDDGSPCGIAGTILDEKDPRRADLVSMWTAPSHRRRAPACKSCFRMGWRTRRLHVAVNGDEQQRQCDSLL